MVPCFPFISYHSATSHLILAWVKDPVNWLSSSRRFHCQSRKAWERHGGRSKSRAPWSPSSTYLVCEWWQCGPFCTGCPWEPTVRGACMENLGKKPFSWVLPSAPPPAYRRVHRTASTQKLCWINNPWKGSDTDTGASATDIRSFSSSETASVVVLISSLDAQPCSSSPSQAALGGQCHVVGDP